MPPNCSRCARWCICTWRGKNCCSWHRLSPGAKVADHGRAAQAGGRPGKTESERLHRPSGTLTTSKTRAYSEFPSREDQVCARSVRVGSEECEQGRIHGYV